MHWYILLSSNLENNLKRLLRTLQKAGERHIDSDAGTPHIRSGLSRLVLSESGELNVGPSSEERSFVPRALAMAQEDDFAVSLVLAVAVEQPHRPYATSTSRWSHAKAERYEKLWQQDEHQSAAPRRKLLRAAMITH